MSILFRSFSMWWGAAKEFFQLRLYAFTFRLLAKQPGSCLSFQQPSASRYQSISHFASKDVVQVLCNFSADLQKRDVFGAMPVAASVK